MSDVFSKEEPKQNSSNEFFTIFEKPTTNMEYKIYLGTSFEAPEKYAKLYNLLDNAKSTDSFTFYLNSYGGRLDSGIQFGSKLAQTKAHTKTVIEGPCYSMGAIFPFMTKEAEMREHTFLMFHMFSTGNGHTKGNEIAMRVDSVSRIFNDLLTVYCGRVLSKAEIKDITEGKDLYIHADDLKKRLTAGKK